mgnify:CR=1 FL=1
MLESSNIVGLICAAGIGSRMGLGFPKQYLRIAGVPIVVHTARALASVSRMSDIVIVVSPTDPYIDDITPLLPPQCRVIKCGGDTRAESVRNGLLRSGFGPTDWVLVHDAARPCVKASEVAHLIDSVTQDMSVAGGILAMPAVDTLKRVDETRRIVETVDRKTVWRAATPQMFRVRNLSLALSGDLSDVTDEASAMERLGLTVKIVPCRTSNIKVTEPSDASLAKYLLGEESMLGIRVGQGYDSHRLVEGRPLIIGGVTIPYEKGLDGHSDADVLLHAITDAVLGAAALGDIGQHFPPTEERWKGADSRELLKAVVALAREHGWEIVNCDATVVAERPKLAPYNAAIRESVAQTLGITIDRVNIKAKTNEKLDDVGAQLGMMAHAVVLLQSA